MTWISADARWLLEQEARALLTRLDLVQPFVLQEPMVVAATLPRTAQLAIERHLIGERVALRERILEYVAWLAGSGRFAPPEEMQRRLTILRVRFNEVLSDLDLFANVFTQRSESETGVWLAGLDAVAADALRLDGYSFPVPAAVCYLDRGPGGAIRRARTRLPAGGENPVAIIRIPRERMVGHGIASSLAHEVGHQAAAILDLVGSLRPVLRGLQRGGTASTRLPWRLWERWISEIVADVWGVAKVGIASTLGLIAVVSLPRWFVFRINADDPHPTPWIRVLLSCAIGDALYPHAQWSRLARIWRALYPPQGAGRARSVIRLMQRSIPSLVSLILEHRPRGLRGVSLREALASGERRPARLLATFRATVRQPRILRRLAPALAFAVVGQARAAGVLSARAESRLLRDLLRDWAMNVALCPAPIPVAVRAPRPITSRRMVEVT